MAAPRGIVLGCASRADAERHARIEWAEDALGSFDDLSPAMQHAMIERSGRIIRRLAATPGVITMPDEEQPKAS